ncbi:LOW QUALITY PROTEIN: cytochrome P450 72A13 [Raphanus sativus]|uniref:LOW QUALITY PROTEIN: cytochrome P450 72A13 n=1 Tax=Raphanus sativus TaxID=3726 RepID=A0A9W3BYZ1_RAPSA|nr:LOW QUALITY PROTEIN: cytochrome P450 72A13 [Raphanus sativus]
MQSHHFHLQKIVLMRVVNWVWLRPKKLESYLRRQGLPGTPYTPLIGDTKRNVKMLIEARSKPITLTDDITPRLLPLTLKMFNSHGRTFFTWNGPDPVIMITNPEHIKEAFGNVHGFEKATSFPLIRLLLGGLASSKGDKWARHKRIINPAFHLEKIKNMVPAFHHCSSEVVCQWEKLFTDKESSCEVDVWPWLVNLTADGISHAAFGSSYRQGQRIFELQGELSQLIAEELKKPYIPGLRFYPTKNNRKIKEIDKEIDTILRGMVRKRREAGEAEHNDLLGILLASSSEESGGNGMSVEEVLRECKMFYFAGQETTAVLLVWTMILLSHHQDWQERAREEVRHILGDDNDKPDIDSLSNLKVMSMIFSEVLRLYPPVAELRREVNKEVKLGELTLPAGVRVYIPTALVHRDTKLWGEDAGEFKPERFKEGISKATKNQVCYFPFGWGLRICIGQNFSLFEAKMAMALILQRFSFELSPSYVHAPQIVMTTRPQFGAHLILHKL